MSKHTPGPWEADSNYIFSKELPKSYDLIAMAIYTKYNLGHDNAKLIAEAPVMLDLLKEAEWVTGEDSITFCPICNNTGGVRHKDTCQLNELLTKLGESNVS